MGSYGNEFYSIGGTGNSPGFSTKDIRSRMDHCYQVAYPANAAYWAQGAIDTRMKAGDQTLWSMVYGDNSFYQSRRFFFNLLRRQINMITGFQRRNRKSTITVPVQQDADPLADQFNKVLKWCENRDGFHEYLSQAFEGSCTTGQSLMHLYLDYTNDPINGDLCTDYVSYNNFLIDPYYRKQDLSDCNFIWRRRWVTKNIAKSLLPWMGKDIDKIRPSGAKDGRFPLQAELLNLNVSQLYTYDEFHYRDTRRAKMVIDPKTGEAVEWQDDEESEEHLKQILMFQPWLKVQEREVSTVKLAISLGNEVVYNGPTILGIDEYPFVPSLCYYDPDMQSYMWRCQGIIRGARDAQYLYNMRKVIELDILQSQINSGWVYPVDAVVDPKSFRQSGQGFLVPLKAGHLPNEIQRIEAPAIPQSMIELSRALSEDITAIIGTNEELLGSATDDKAGILSMLRQGAGLTTLQGIFDRLDYTQRLYGNLRLKAVQKNFNKMKIRNILGEEAHPGFFSSYALKYTIAVEEGNYSTTQRQMELQQLLHFKELGMPISDKDILNAAFITNKAKIVENMEQQQQMQMQAQQQQMQDLQQKTQAEIAEKMARVQDLKASAVEKQSKTIQNAAQAEHQKAQADLELVQMMIALEDMDLANLRASFELAQQIKQANTQTMGEAI